MRFLTCGIATGGDELRGNTDNTFATFTLNGNRKIQFPLNKSFAWANDMIVKRIFALPTRTKVSDIKSITIATTFGGGISGDNQSPDPSFFDILHRRLLLMRHLYTRLTDPNVLLEVLMDHAQSH